MWRWTHVFCCESARRKLVKYMHTYMSKTSKREREKLGHRTRGGTKIAFCARTAVPDMDRGVQSTQNTYIVADYKQSEL